MPRLAETSCLKRSGLSDFCFDPAGDQVRLDALALALKHDRFERICMKAILRRLPGGFADDDLAGLGDGGLEAARDVHDIADDRVVLALRGADIADDGAARIDANAHPDWAHAFSRFIECL